MSKVFKPEEILGKTETRSVALLARDITIDEENRTVELAFSSDAPIRHWFGYLILDHKKESVRLERINASGALLWMHDRRTQIGSVSNVRIDSDGKGRALAKFSRGTLGEEKFQDVKDEICRTTSFGFCLYQLDAEVGQDGKQAYIDGEPVYRSRDWEPFEVSLEPIPADCSVGINRSFEDLKPGEITEESLNKNLARGAGNSKKTEKKMEEENDVQPGEQTRTASPPAPIVPPAQAAPAASNTNVRAAQVIAYGELFGTEAGNLAREMALANPNVTEAEIGQAIIAKRAANQKAVPPASPESVASRQGGSEIEIVSGIQRGGVLKSFRGAEGRKTAYRMGQWLAATVFRNQSAQEFCRTNGIPMDRTQTGSVNELGGFLVPEEFENVLIDLRIQYGVFRRNANVVPMSTDTKSRPRRTGGLTAYPVGSNQKAPKSDLKWDRVELHARKWKVTAKYEEDFSEDALISIADTLASEIAYAFTEVEDRAGFIGDGSGAFHGIVGVINRLRNPGNASSLPAVANVAGLIEASGNIWDEITKADLLKVIGRLPQFARTSGNVKWYCSNEFFASVLTRIALESGGVTYAEIAGELKEIFMGKPVELVEVMPHTEANSQIPLLYGNLNQAAMFGDRRGVSIKMTDSNEDDFDEDLMTIKGTERFDINVHDVGNVDSNADKRKAGPIVGLITKGS